MRKEYDFDKMKGRRNPYSQEFKTQVTIRLDVDTVRYFKELSKRTDTPYPVPLSPFIIPRPLACHLTRAIRGHMSGWP